MEGAETQVITTCAIKTDNFTNHVDDVGAALNRPLSYHNCITPNYNMMKNESKIKLIFHEQISCQDLQSQIKY